MGGVRYIWVLPSMFASEHNMAQRINVVLHDSVDENNVSSSDDDECSSIESDVGWMSSVMLLVLMENVRMTLPMQMVGLMLISCM